jgi:hypothetical protein
MAGRRRSDRALRSKLCSPGCRATPLMAGLLPHPKILPRTVRLSRKIVPAPSTAFPSRVPLQELRQPTISRIPHSRRTNRFWNV